MKRLSKVLLVDDDEITNFLHRTILVNSGITNRVEVAETVRSALDILDSNGSKDDPRLILLDLNMPGMTGWDFIEEYKKRKHVNRDNILIVLSASANPEDEERSKRYPEVAAFKRKPLTGEMVNDIIKEFFQ